MIKQILDYFKQTGRKVPELLPAVIFAQTELGETFDAIMRSGMVGDGWLRNNERESQIEIELADTYMMLLLAASAIEVDLDAVLAAKMIRKGWQPAPWLLQAWQQAFFEKKAEERMPVPPDGSDFKKALWQYCLQAVDPEGDAIKQKETLAVDLRRQREVLDGLIQVLEIKDHVL